MPDKMLFLSDYQYLRGGTFVGVGMKYVHCIVTYVKGIDGIFLPI